MGEERGEKAEGSRRWLPERRKMDFAMDMGEWLLLKTAEQSRERERERDVDTYIQYVIIYDSMVESMYIIYMKHEMKIHTTRYYTGSTFLRIRLYK